MIVVLQVRVKSEAESMMMVLWFDLVAHWRRPFGEDPVVGALNEYISCVNMVLTD